MASAYLSLSHSISSVLNQVRLHLIASEYLLDGKTPLHSVTNQLLGFQRDVRAQLRKARAGYASKAKDGKPMTVASVMEEGAR